MSSSTKILAGVFVLLAIAAYFLLPSGKEREVSYKPAEVNLSIDSASIVKIDLQHPGKSVTIENISGKWTITSPIHYAANSSTVAELISGLRKFKAGSLVSSNPEKQNLFQVDTTGSKITLTDRSGKSTSLIVGKTGPSSSEVYFRLPDFKDVYLGEGLSTWVINQDLKDWRDKTIFSTTSDSIKQLAFNYRKKNLVLRRDSTTWKYGEDSIATNIMTSTLNTLSNLRADDFVDTLYQPKTRPFGIKIQSAGEVALNFFPQPPDSSKYFVQTSQSPQGFLLNKWTVQELLRPIEKFQK
ncbi:MAG: DUF4340 domain-containing protein [Bacteroidota bacterium]